MPKKIFTQELEGTRRRGRPRKGWKEEVERDLQVLGVRRSRELVADRKKWKDIVQQAKAHSGLLCQWEKKKKNIRFLQTSNGQHLQSESKHGPENHETYHDNQLSFQDTNPEPPNQYAGLPTSTPKKKTALL